MLLLSGNEAQKKKISNNLDTQPHCPAHTGQSPALQLSRASPSFHLPAYTSFSLHSLQQVFGCTTPRLVCPGLHPSGCLSLPPQRSRSTACYLPHHRAGAAAPFCCVFWCYSILPFLLLSPPPPVLPFLFTIPSAFLTTVLLFLLLSIFILSPFFLHFFSFTPRFQ